jgi:hypothetical protein
MLTTNERHWPDFYRPQPNPRDTYSYLDESGLDVDWRDVQSSPLTLAPAACMLQESTERTTTDDTV